MPQYTDFESFKNIIRHLNASGKVIKIDAEGNFYADTDAGGISESEVQDLIDDAIANMATDAEVTSAISTHNSDTTAVHGITDTSALATTAGVTSEISTHNSDTTNVHGIADTAALGSGTPLFNPAGGGANDQEFTSATIGGTLSGTLDTENTNTTQPSHWYGEKSATTGDAIRYWSAPGATFTVTMKLSGVWVDNENSAVGLAVMAGSTERMRITIMIWSGTPRVLVSDAAGTAYNSGQIDSISGATTYIGDQFFFKIRVNSNTSYDAWWSRSGRVWMPVVTARNPTGSGTIDGAGAICSVSNVGRRAFGAVDWIRYG